MDGNHKSDPSELGNKRFNEVGDRLKAIADERASIEAEIAQKFPRYYQLIKPRALGIEEVQKLLAPDEALVLTSRLAGAALQH